MSSEHDDKVQEFAKALNSIDVHSLRVLNKAKVASLYLKQGLSATGLKASVISARYEREEGRPHDPRLDHLLAGIMFNPFSQQRFGKALRAYVQLSRSLFEDIRQVSVQADHQSFTWRSKNNDATKQRKSHQEHDGEFEGKALMYVYPTDQTLHHHLSLTHTSKIMPRKNSVDPHASNSKVNASGIAFEFSCGSSIPNTKTSTAASLAKSRAWRDSNMKNSSINRRITQLAATGQAV